MTNIQISDEELQLYFNYLMKNNGVFNIQNCNLIDEEEHHYSAEELALEVV